MAYVDLVNVTCKNKICNEGNRVVVINQINGVMPDPLPECPYCGFKTLDQFAMTVDQQETLVKEVEKMYPNGLRKGSILKAHSLFSRLN